MSLTVQTVVSKQAWNDFFELPRSIYANDPAAVFPMRFMNRAALDTKSNPFYLHASREVFVCYRGGTPVGRIVAIVDDLHNEYYDERMGFFGFFESIDDTDITRALFDTASNWLRDRGCTHVRGPVNPSMKAEFGIVVRGHGDPPFVRMAYSTPYYQRLVEDYGFEKKMDFFALLYDATKYYDDAMTRDRQLGVYTEKVLKRYPKIKMSDCPKKEFDETIREINRLGNIVRSVGFGYVPMTDPELDYMVSQLRRVVRHDTILRAHWDGKLVGYCINLPCINWALQKTVGRSDWIRLPQFLYWLKRTPRSRVIAIGADPEYRNKGVGALLAFEMSRRGVRMRSFKQWEFSWVAENNIRSIRNIERSIPVENYKTYRLYEKQV